MRRLHTIRISSPWYVCVLGLGILVGTVLARIVGMSAVHIGVLCVLGIGISTRVFPVRGLRYIVLSFCAGITIGYLRGDVVDLHDRAVVEATNQPARVVGTLTDAPKSVEGGSWMYTLRDVQVNNTSMYGKVLVYSTVNDALLRSDRVEFVGNPRLGFGAYPISINSARVESVERSSQRDYAGRFGRWFSERVRRELPPASAALGLGFLIGEKSSIPEEIEIDMRRSGLTHIVVASGYNLTVLVLLARRVFRKVSRFSALMASGWLVVGFVAVSGSSPSLVRAGVVALISSVMWYFGQKPMAGALIVTVASVTVLYNPYYIWGI